MQKQNATALTAIIASVFFIETKDGKVFCAGLAPELVVEDDAARSAAWADLATSNPGFLKSLSETLAKDFVVDGKPSMSEIIGWHQGENPFQAADESRLKLWATGLYRAIQEGYELPEDYRLPEGANDEDCSVIAQCYFEHLQDSAAQTAPEAVTVVGDETAQEDVQAISADAVAEAVQAVTDPAVANDAAVAVDAVESAQAIIEGANLPAQLNAEANAIVASGKFEALRPFLEQHAAGTAKQLTLLSELLASMSEQQTNLAALIASTKTPVTAE